MPINYGFKKRRSLERTERELGYYMQIFTGRAGFQGDVTTRTTVRDIT